MTNGKELRGRCCRSRHCIVFSRGLCSSQTDIFTTFIRLCGLKVSTIKTEFDLQDVKIQQGDFAVKDLSNKVNTETRNDIIVRSYMTYCSMCSFLFSSSHMRVCIDQ